VFWGSGLTAFLITKVNLAFHNFRSVGFGQPMNLDWQSTKVCPNLVSKGLPKLKTPLTNEHLLKPVIILFYLKPSPNTK
jgi:hypothetical protein